MCINLGLYPLVELDNGKRKVLFNYGIAIENRDFQTLNSYELSWNNAIRGAFSLRENFNYAVKKYGVKKFLKYTQVPCGKCEECKKARARGWAFRILKEAEKYENNYFITFTYDDNFLPINSFGINTLVKDEMSKFNKKLKTYLKRIGKNSDFRFYLVGEYGGQTFRPHYHVIYFNLDLPVDDFKLFKYENGYPTFTSDWLSNTWSKGFVSIGFVDVGSACYVARYVDKKLNRSKEEKEFLSNIDIVSEFSNCSRRPGIGADFLDKVVSNIKNEIYSCSIRGNDFSLPLYYSKKVKDLLDPETLNKYEARNDYLMKIKFNNDLLLSDVLSTDLQSYYILEDNFRKSCKKVRDNIKLY